MKVDSSVCIMFMLSFVYKQIVFFIVNVFKYYKNNKQLSLECDILESLGGNPKSCLWINNDQNILSGGDETLIR